LYPTASILHLITRYVGQGCFYFTLTGGRRIFV
jgi:hypothetical protein